MSKPELNLVQVAAEALTFYTRAAERDLDTATAEIKHLRNRLTSMLQTLERTEARLTGKAGEPEPSTRDKTYILRLAADSLRGDATVIAETAARMSEQALGAKTVLDALAGIQNSAK